MKHFCTIITGDHLHKALALYDSLRQLDSDVHLHILSINACSDFPQDSGLTLYHPEQFFDIENAKTIAHKYSNTAISTDGVLSPSYCNIFYNRSIQKLSI
jgi:hypothetical protein